MWWSCGRVSWRSHSDRPLPFFTVSGSLCPALKSGSLYCLILTPNSQTGGKKNTMTLIVLWAINSLSSSLICHQRTETAFKITEESWIMSAFLAKNNVVGVKLHLPCSSISHIIHCMAKSMWTNGKTKGVNILFFSLKAFHKIFGHDCSVCSHPAMRTSQERSPVLN